MIEWIIGAAIAGATYAAAKKKVKATNKQAAIAAAAAGTGAAGVTWVALGIFSAIWPVALIAAPVAAGYWWMNRRENKQVGGSDRKMLGPGG